MLSIPKDLHFCFEYLLLDPPPRILCIDHIAITVYLKRSMLQLTLPFAYDLEHNLFKYVKTTNVKDYKGY